MQRRDFMKLSAAAAIAPAVTRGVPADPREPGKYLKIGILFGDAPDRPPGEIAEGFDVAEVPNTILISPMSTASAWAKAKAQIKAWNLPPIRLASHFIDGTVTGPDVDTEWLDLWVKRSFARMAELGVEVAGVYGSFFAYPDGFPKAKAREQGLRFANSLADGAKANGMLVALEPMGRPNTMWPLYLDALAFAKELGRPEIRLMADLNYFIGREQPLENILKAPEYCLHCHIAGVKGQPGVGDRVAIHRRLFEVLRDMKYERAVSCACPWVDTTGTSKLQFRVETAKTLQYLRELRDRVYSS